MAKSKRDGFQIRRTRVRSELRAHAVGRARLSVHRSAQNIYAQLIDDAAAHSMPGEFAGHR